VHDNINVLQNALYLTDNFFNFWTAHHSLTILIV